MDTLVDLLRNGRDRYGEAPALSIRSGLREDVWSYRRLWEGAGAVASYLRHELGLPAGERVIVWGPNSPQLVAAYFGVNLARLVLVPIDPLSPPDFVGRVADKTRAGALLTGFGPISLNGTRVIPLANLPYGEPGMSIDDRPAPDDLAEIVFTSGTTGTPKGVILTHRNIIANVRSASRLVPDRPYRLVSILPLSHMLEQTIGLYVPLLLGGSVHYTPSRHPRVLARAWRRHRVTALALVPQVLEVIYQNIENEVASQHRERSWRLAHRLAGTLPMPLRRILFRRVLAELGGKLEFVICGGARLAPDLMMAWERMGVRVIVGYGATECAPLITGNSYTVRVPDSVGTPAPGVAVRLSPEGEVLVRGPNVTSGYWEDPDATATAFVDDGWYRTGDLGTLDAQGRLHLTGRLRDLIVLPSGLNVHPEDVEAELRREPSVEDCVVLAKADTAGRQTVHAVVIPSEGSEAAEVAVAVRRASQRLSQHQHVAGYTIWDEADFPRTNLRKVKRHEVEAAIGRLARPKPAAAAPGSGDPMLDDMRAMLSDLTGVVGSDITPDTTLDRELDLDSLARVELAIAIERRFGMPVEDDELAAITTVGGLVELVAGTRPEPAPPRFPAWPRWRAWIAARSLLQRTLLFPIHALFARPFRVEGMAHLDGISPPVLLIANHASHADTPSVLRALPHRIRRRTAVAAAADYFYAGRVRGGAMSLLLGTFPFSREGAVRASLEHCGTLVDAGWSVLIYPEGTRSTTGSVGRFRSGIGLLAGHLGVPVAPVGILGTYSVLPKGTKYPHRHAVTVRFGPPLTPEAEADRTDLVKTLEHAVHEQLTERSGRPT